MKLKRKLYLLKCRTQVLFRHLIEWVLMQLSEWGWIFCHNLEHSNTTDDGKVHQAPDIANERFIFSVSYVVQKVYRKREYWYETKKGKRLYTIEDTHLIEGILDYRAELKAFFAHFSPSQRMWVNCSSPNVALPKYTRDGLLMSGDFRCYWLDFSQCRYAFRFKFDYCADRNVSSEVISQSHRTLENMLTSKIPEINKILTGANYDGEMMSPKNMPLSENIICRHCGLPVFAYPDDKYRFECLEHGALDYPYVDRVDPVKYKTVLENTRELLEDLIRDLCPKDSNL